MIGRVTSVGMIDYTASYDGEKLHLYENSKPVGEKEIKGLSGAVFEGNVICYTVRQNNVIFSETVLGHYVRNHILERFKSVWICKKLSDCEFIIKAETETDEKYVVFDAEKNAIFFELPCKDGFHDFVYDGSRAFRLSGHNEINISVYYDDYDSEDIIYGEYSIDDNDMITAKRHFGICNIENGDHFVSSPDSSNIVFSLFDNYLDYYFFPNVLTQNYIVAKCDQHNGFIVYSKGTGKVKYLISLPERIYSSIDIYGFNEQTDMLTVIAGGKLHRYKVILSAPKVIDELNDRYMTTYNNGKTQSIRNDFEFGRLFYKAIDACEIYEIAD